ncbi:hypothetical protein ACWEG1_28780 [Streptomyces bauhiniae]
MYGTMDTASKVAIFVVIALVIAGVSVGVMWFGKSNRNDSPDGE